MKKYLCTLIVLFISTTNWAVTLPEVQNRLSQQSVVKAQFTQERTIKGMAKPLHSSGQMIVSKEKGLWWQQNKPFELTLLMTQTVMKQKTGNQSSQVITATDNAQLFQFNSLLSALFKADKATLEKNFSFKFTDKGNDRWEIQLTPTMSPLNKIFKKITMSGKNYLEQVFIDDKQGDKTTLRFSNHSTQALTENEKKRFNF